MKSLESLEIINICLKELADEHKEDTNIWRYDLEVIKQDLEVLEILRKYRIDLIGLDNEDYNKLKQWLKENENDR